MNFFYRQYRVNRIFYGVGSAIATSFSSVTLLISPSFAQLVPDTSLGQENSVVTPGATVRGLPADLIEGGASRGGNLFHSFSEFNISTGQAVYFANPTGIDNILTRITGGSVSSIDGLLGVDGAANLFLLNPNGVIFGPNAWLDISSSLFVSTADSLVFADGSVFNAVPQANELLSMSVPPGVQLNSPTQADIFSAGLLITGQDLSLLGSNLYLEGPLLSGRDITLYAADTVTIRHAPNDPIVPTFVANAGGALTIQGDRQIDILLQKFGEPSFVSGGPLTLYSNGEMYVAAQFQSGGSLQFFTPAGAPGTLRSDFSPILFANGDVVLGDYTGASLKIEATGTIQAGNIVITGPDTTLVSDGSGSDEDVLASRHAVILRAGVNSAGDGNIPQPPSNTVLAPETAIGQLPGSINVSFIDTVFNDELADGGVILLMAAGNIYAPSLETRSGSAEGNGGTITLLANGDIYASDVNSLSFNRDGGAITFTAGGDIVIDAPGGGFMTASTFSTSDGNGGAITLTSLTGNIWVVGELFSVATLSNNDLASGGTIQLTALAGDIFLSAGGLYSYAYSEGSSTAGSGGRVVLEAPQGGIFGGGSRVYSFAVATGDDTSSGNGGEVVLVARDQVSDLEVLTLSSSGVSGNVSIEGRGDLRIQNVTLTTSANFQIPDPLEPGGVIEINTSRIGQSGNTFITSPGTLTFENVLVSSNANGSQPGGNIEVIAADQVSFVNSAISSNAFSTGGAGSITVETPFLLLVDSNIAAETFGQGQGGNIEIRATEGVTLIGPFSYIAAATFSNEQGGPGGNVQIETSDLAVLDGGFIAAETFGQGEGGNVRIQNDGGSLVIRGDGRVTVEAAESDSGEAGEIAIAAANLALRDGVELRASSASEQGGGNIVITVDRSLVMRDNSFINATSSNPSAGDGGNIAIRLGNGFLIAGSEQNNDVIANAVGGNGGNINISALRLFGFSLQDEPNVAFLRGNGTNDISASSEVGLPGAIALDTLAIDPSQGLVELPVDLSDRANQITPGCGLGSTSDQGEFVVTGRGGLPPNPSDPLGVNGVEVPWVMADNGEPVATGPVAMNLAARAVNSLVEAQGIGVDAEGNAYFVAEAKSGEVPWQAAIASQPCPVSAHP